MKNNLAYSSKEFKIRNNLVLTLVLVCLQTFGQESSLEGLRNFKHDEILSKNITMFERFAPKYNQTKIYNENGDEFLIDTLHVLKALYVDVGTWKNHYGPWVECFCHYCDSLQGSAHDIFYIEIDKIKSVETREFLKDKEIVDKERKVKNNSFIMFTLFVIGLGFLIYYLKTLCPNCKSIFTRNLIKKESDGYRDFQTTVYEKSHVYDKHDKHIGHIKTPKRINASTYYYIMHYKCKKCGHIWSKKKKDTYYNT